jgi:hypothetical protein
VAEARATAGDADILRRRVAEAMVQTESLREENQGLRQRLASFKQERVAEQQRLFGTVRQWQPRRR